MYVCVHVWMTDILAGLVCPQSLPWSKLVKLSAVLRSGQVILQEPFFPLSPSRPCVYLFSLGLGTRLALLNSFARVGLGRRAVFSSLPLLPGERFSLSHKLSLPADCREHGGLASVCHHLAA